MNTQVVVGIGDCAISADPDVLLVTYALGSCIAVTIYDPVAKVGGLLHYMLPDSTIDAVRARQNPFLYADTGVPALFQQAQQRGAEKRRLKVRVAGGAQVLNDGGFFDIGKRNYLSLKKMLWQVGVIVEQEAVGGCCYRTVRLQMEDGNYVLQEGPIHSTNPVGGVRR
jgi:chemotaxis protein CheD